MSEIEKNSDLSAGRPLTDLEVRILELYRNSPEHVRKFMILSAYFTVAAQEWQEARQG